VLNKLNEDFNLVVHDLDNKLNTVVSRHEEQYLKGYSIFVRDKERQLRELIIKLNNRSNDNSLKDEIIYGLKDQLAKEYER
jgi:hypothetical protein